MPQVRSALALVALAACAPSDPLADHAQAVEASPEVRAWLAEHALPLATVEAGHGFDDLRPLAATLGDARVIALGEATHGSREFFQAKLRLLEWLVAEGGVTVLGFEGLYGEATDVDAYVQGAPRTAGDAARVIGGLSAWPWMTDEVTELVEWMRRWNRMHPHRRVRFAGFDMQLPDRAVRDVLAYLRAVDPAEAPRFAASLHLATSRYDFFTVPPDAYDAMRIEAEALLALLDARADLYRARSSPEAFTHHRQLARVAVQALVMTYADFTGGEWDGSNLRDAAMADNVEWLVAQAGGGRVLLWAHNDHVTKAFELPDYVPMGQHLAARLGGDYRALGFAFDRGGFQALGPTLRLQEFVVESGGPETLDGVLAEVAPPIAALPLRDVPAAGPVADYFATPPVTRDVTAGYLPDLAEFYFRSSYVADVFDALLFVAETTGARPTVYARDQLAPQGTNPAPQNLGLETETGGVPDGWFAPISNEVGGYTVALSPVLPVEGARTATLARGPGLGYGRNYGELRQRVSAVPYRGQRVRLRASIRATTAPGARVHLWMRVGARYDGMHDRPITTSGWTTYDLVLPVALTATRLDFGLVVVGDGAASIDAVSLEPVAP